jgi:hypothetical protein
MAAYKMAAVKVTPTNDFPLGLIRSHMVVIHLFLMFCDLQRVVRDLCTILYISEGPRVVQNLAPFIATVILLVSLSPSLFPAVS